MNARVLTQPEGDLIGYVTFGEGATHEPSQEVACWYSKWLIDPGTYPVYAKQSYGRRGYWVEVPATLIENYTPSLFGGVRIGGRDGSEACGQRGTIRKGGGYYSYFDHRAFGDGRFTALPDADLSIGYGHKIIADAMTEDLI